MRPYVLMFLTILLAELGDKTQLATLLFATDPAVNRWGVLLVCAAALVVSAAIAVAAGAWLGSWAPPRAMRVLGGLGFLAAGVWMLVRA